ncbi:hypothetical protein EG68_04266 [Paragonimus skrjabini miyazakii]|uniref:DH domain-containing protein n=1 Tax=Paragonimus skrjabini miyazakii TaxID=59628 RepID=A0A8S9YZR2_9TREM|nr:hypothetical protein EG68_04266 [Paragonimus skrjabini miyazakii]
MTDIKPMTSDVNRNWAGGGGGGSSEVESNESVLPNEHVAGLAVQATDTSKKEKVDPEKLPLKPTETDVCSCVSVIQEATTDATGIANPETSPDVATNLIMVQSDTPNNEPTTFSESKTETQSRERVFQIILEDESSDSKNLNNDEQIFYLPLALGTSTIRAGDSTKDFASLTGLSADSGSDTFMRDVGRSLSQTGDYETSPETGRIKAQSFSDKEAENEPTAVPISSGFLTPKSTLLTDSLIKSGAVPDSITQKFNEIAKLNKNSLKSRRTVRTSTTRIKPITTSASSLCELADAEKIALVKMSTSQETKEQTSSLTTRTAVPMSKEGFHAFFTSPSNTPSDQKRPYHARFHSDETTPMTDYSIHSNKSADSRQSDDSQTTESSSSTTHSIRQPVTYVRSVTAERLPVFIRSTSGSSCVGGGTGVLRSKSAASTLPHNLSRVSTADTALSEPKELTRSACTPRSLPESSLNSQHNSGVQTASTDGSTNSLPSLSTAGATSSVMESLDVTVDQRKILPTGSDPSLTLETTQSDHFSTESSLVDLKSTSGQPSAVATQDRMTNDTYIKLLKRRHIMKELIQVEKEYVNSLATLVNIYMVPLKQEKILDDQQVDTIFYKVNELFNLHMSFLNTLQMWELTNTVGDKLLDMFSREAVASCYCSFVENFPNSEKTLETCWNTKSSFQKFCEQKLRILRSKLPLKALLVQPIQRIPRYELLVKRLIEYTPKEYSDNALLNEAKVAIHRLAVRVNAIQADGQDESMVDGVKLLERLLSPATLTPNRIYIRHDTVSLEDRKDPVCIFMFTDQIVFTVAKRRGSQVLKKPLLLRLRSPKGVDTIENIKYKIFHRLGIEAIEFEQCAESEGDRLVQHRELRDKKDLALLAEIDNISSKLEYRHHDLDMVVRQLYQSVQQELEGLRTARNTLTSIPKNLSVFTATTKEGIERYELMFPTSEKRQDWERTVIELKRQLSTVKRTSKFNDALEIPRTLPGIQLSCAAVVEVAQLTKTTPRDVWICAADGYTGYLCLLTLHPKPMIALNIPLAGCNSRITCICAVPGCPNPTSRRVSGGHGIGNICPRLVTDNVRSNRQRILKSKSEEPVNITVEDSDTVSTTKKVFPLKKLASEAMTRSFVDVNALSTECIHTPKPQLGHTEDKTDPLTLSSSMIVDVQKAVEDDGDILQETEKKSSQEELGKSPTNVQAFDAGLPTFGIDEKTTQFLAQLISDEPENPASENTDSSDASETEHDLQEENMTNQITPAASKSNTSLGDQTSDQSEQTRNVKSFRLTDPFRSTMWLGTEEGSIFIFYATDNIKTNRRRQRITLSSAINSILHLDVRIFITCINGDFLVYDRNSGRSKSQMVGCMVSFQLWSMIG